MMPYLAVIFIDLYILIITGTCTFDFDIMLQNTEKKKLLGKTLKIREDTLFRCHFIASVKHISNKVVHRYVI